MNKFFESHRDARIFSLEDLVFLSENKKSVIHENMGRMPAAIVFHFQGNVIHRLLKTGLFIYKKNDNKQLFPTQLKFDVILEAVGDNKIQVIKAIRVITSLSLKESIELVNTTPRFIKSAVSKEEAESIKSQLEEVGATVILK